MNGMSHIKYMLLGGAGLFGVLVLLGVPAQSAIFLAIALACPLMMVFMMAGGHGGHGSEITEKTDDIERSGSTRSPNTTHQHH